MYVCMYVCIKLYAYNMYVCIQRHSCVAESIFFPRTIKHFQRKSLRFPSMKNVFHMFLLTLFWLILELKLPGNTNRNTV